VLKLYRSKFDRKIFEFISITSTFAFAFAFAYVDIIGGSRKRRSKKNQKIKI
jgi:hypothetical protein